jgi:hypothetical protein
MPKRKEIQQGYKLLARWATGIKAIYVHYKILMLTDTKYPFRLTKTANSEALSVCKIFFKLIWEVVVTVKEIFGNIWPKRAAKGQALIITKPCWCYENTKTKAEKNPSNHYKLFFWSTTIKLPNQDLLHQDLQAESRTTTSFAKKKRTTTS